MTMGLVHPDSAAYPAKMCWSPFYTGGGVSINSDKSRRSHESSLYLVPKCECWIGGKNDYYSKVLSVLDCSRCITHQWVLACTTLNLGYLIQYSLFQLWQHVISLKSYFRLLPLSLWLPAQTHPTLSWLMYCNTRFACCPVIRTNLQLGIFHVIPIPKASDSAPAEPSTPDATH